MAEQQRENDTGGPPPEVLDTTKLMDDAAERCDDLAARLVMNEDRSKRDANTAELSALALFRIACALENLQAEATETLMEEAARVAADGVEPMGGPE